MNNFKSILFTLLATLVKDESGQDLVEYGLIAGLIGLGTIAGLSRLAGNLATELSTIGSTLTAST
jgi:pilus assembly protein Flp/PilA